MLAKWRIDIFEAYTHLLIHRNSKPATKDQQENYFDKEREDEIENCDSNDWSDSIISEKMELELLQLEMRGDLLRQGTCMEWKESPKFKE